MGNRFDEMREKIGIAPQHRSAKEVILYSIIDELEKLDKVMWEINARSLKNEIAIERLSEELHQGYIRIERQAP